MIEFGTKGIFEVRCRENRIEIVYTTKEKAFDAYWKEAQKTFREVDKMNIFN